MKSHLVNFWETLRSTYWFVPGLMMLGAIGLSYGLLMLDQHVKIPTTSGFAWIYAGSATGARSVLSTVAASVITVAGTTFSITIAALTLASSQFGPRLLRGFLRDTGNQVVLGTFTGTFVYCLLVLRTIRGAQDAFVPNVAITGGVALALACVGVLIYFINHVSTSIQASHVISAAAAELDETIDRIYPTSIGGKSAEPERSSGEPLSLAGTNRAIVAECSGYVRLIDESRLITLARAAEGVIEIVRPPGAFVSPGAPIAVLHSDQPRPDDLSGAVNEAFVLGLNKTMTQDIGFGIEQLVEVAVRALSPGINDPFTAMSCVDRLGAALALIAGREPPPSKLRDDNGAVRVIAVPPPYPAMVNMAFDQIRQYGRGSFAVTLHLLETLESVAARASRDSDRAALRRQANLVRAGAEALPDIEDRQAVAARYLATLRAFREGGGRIM